MLGTILVVATSTIATTLFIILAVKFVKRYKID